MIARLGDDIKTTDGAVLRVDDVFEADGGYMGGYLLSDGSVVLDAEIASGAMTVQSRRELAAA